MSGPNPALPPVGQRGQTPRAPDAPVIVIPLDPRSDRALHRQVYDGLRDSILAGRLAPGARLPSTRTLAADLGVARNTVTLAFDDLRTEGYIQGKRGGGTRVRSAIPDVVLNVPHRRTNTLRGTAATPTNPTQRIRVSERGTILVNAGRPLVHRGGSRAVPFRTGVPALEAFPATTWARLTARQWRRGLYIGDSNPAGEPALRHAIAEYVTNARGARCTAEQVVVVSGTQQAIDLIARVFVDPGDPVWLEDPGYPAARATFAAAGARVLPVTVDAEGIDVAAGERNAPHARLAYVTPSHQFPLGVVMSAPRRFALLAWARRTGAWIVEDDYDSEFRYTGRPLPCLQGLDEEQRLPNDLARVLYIGTFSKTLAPGLRLGYLVVPNELVEIFRAVRSATDRHSPVIEQAVLADFIGEGHYARHIRRVRTMYADRQDALLNAAARELGGLLTLAPDAAGLHLVGWLPSGVSDMRASAAARNHGVEALALSTCRAIQPGPMDRGGLLLNYAGFDVRSIRTGIGKLARALGAP